MDSQVPMVPQAFQVIVVSLECQVCVENHCSELDLIVDLYSIRTTGLTRRERQQWIPRLSWSVIHTADVSSKSISSVFSSQVFLDRKVTVVLMGVLVLLDYLVRDIEQPFSLFLIIELSH